MAQSVRRNSRIAFGLADLKFVLADLRHTKRLLSILRTLGRYDCLFLFDEAPLSPLIRWMLRLLAGRPDPSATRLREGERLAAALHTLGPSFIKLGQALSVRGDIVGQAIADDLGQLRDRLPPAPWGAARQILAVEIGAAPETVFETIDPEPVAAASIAQVHFAVTLAGEPVALKILRPDIEQAFARDLALFSWLADTAERRYPPVRRLRPGDVVATLATTVAQEMDLRLEAAAASELAENLAGVHGFRLPRVLWQLTGRRVLAMERISGTPVDDVESLRRQGHDLSALANRVIQVFLTQALAHGFFHADMHHGNLFVDADGSLVAVDFGIMGRLDRPTRLFMAEMLYSFLTADWRRAAEVHFRAGYVPADRSIEAFAQACRAVGEPILGRPVSEISLGRLLAQLFQITEIFGMRTQPHLLLLQKTMVTVEGVARTLDPQVNFWDAARPVIQPWAEDNLSPEARLRDGIEDGLATLKLLPDALRALRERLERPDPASAEHAKAPSDVARADFWAVLAIGLLALLVLNLVFR